jgi:hypothetical protein
VTESKRFESDPALFVSSMDWRGADYVVTFNSYLDAVSPLLKGGGFRLVSLVWAFWSLLTMVSVLSIMKNREILDLILFCFLLRAFEP